MALSVRDLIPHLIEATNEGKLKWTANEFNPSSDFYAYVSGKYEINIWSWDDADTGTSGFSISLKRTPFDKSTNLDQVSSDEYNPRSGTLSHLHNLARRSANDVDSAIREIQDALGVIPF